MGMSTNDVQLPAARLAAEREKIRILSEGTQPDQLILCLVNYLITTASHPFVLISPLFVVYCSVMNVSTADIDKSNDCLAWLRSHNAQGLDQIVFKYSSDAGGSLGCYAAKDFKKGDVLFAIPQKCLFGIENTTDTELTGLLRKSASELGNSKLLTSELLIWLHMCQQRSDPESMFYPYFNSLDNQPPNLDNWPTELKSAFTGTSLAASIADNAPQNSIATHATLVTHALQDTTYNADSYNSTHLHWARGHYLSRRYPGKYATHHSVLTETEQSTDGREYGMQNLGIMVPLLDILNHDASREWLRFEVRDEALQVICNHPRKKGQELYSNYGALSNEVLLYAYGFAVPNNPFDSVTFKLVGGGSSGNSGSGSGSGGSSEEALSFSITAGGISGVPTALWSTLSVVLGTTEGHEENHDEDDGPAQIGMEECDALLQYLERKLQALDDSEQGVQELVAKYTTSPDTPAPTKRRKIDTSTATTDTSTTTTTTTIPAASSEHIQYIKHYRQGQRAIIQELAQELQEILESAGSEEEEEGEEGSGDEEEQEEDKESGDEE